jgi:hypothetical protein
MSSHVVSSMTPTPAPRESHLPIAEPWEADGADHRPGKPWADGDLPVGEPWPEDAEEMVFAEPWPEDAAGLPFAEPVGEPERPAGDPCPADESPAGAAAGSGPPPPAAGPPEPVVPAAPEKLVLDCALPAALPAAAAWQDELSTLLAGSGSPATADGPAEAVRAWLRATVAPALSRLAVEFRRNGRRARASARRTGEAGLQVWGRDGGRLLDVKFRLRASPTGAGVVVRELVREGHRMFVHERPVREAPAGMTEEDVIRFVLEGHRARAGDPR